MTAARPTGHRCDPVTSGGLVTYSRVLRSILAGMDTGLPQDVLNEQAARRIARPRGDCFECWVFLLSSLAAVTADTLAKNEPDARMILELNIAVVAAALACGETEMPPGGLTR